MDDKDDKSKPARDDSDNGSRTNVVTGTHDLPQRASLTLYDDKEKQQGIKAAVDPELEKRLANPLKVLSERSLKRCASLGSWLTASAFLAQVRRR